MGNNCEQQLCSSEARTIRHLTALPLNLKSEEGVELHCRNNFVLCLVSKPISCDFGKDQGQ